MKSIRILMLIAIVAGSLVLVPSRPAAAADYWNSYWSWYDGSYVPYYQRYYSYSPGYYGPSYSYYPPPAYGGYYGPSYGYSPAYGGAYYGLPGMGVGVYSSPTVRVSPLGIGWR